MVDPIAIGQTKKYILERERAQKEIKEGDKVIQPAREASPNPTVWIIGPIDSIDQNRILSLNYEANIKEDGSIERVRNIDAVLNNDFVVVKHGLKGFENFGNLKFETEKEKFFTIEKDVVADKIIRSIHIDIIRELSDVIWNWNNVDEGLIKN